MKLNVIYPWSHHPEYFHPDLFEGVYQELDKFCKYHPKTYYINGERKTFQSKRRSCYFSDSDAFEVEANSKFFSYGDIDNYSWSDSVMIRALKVRIESNPKFSKNGLFDYCLVHIYDSGENTIAWHSDRESMKKDIVSLSFGATRKFRIRLKGETKGWLKEFELGSGDLFHMEDGCQQLFEHCVPAESGVKSPRINMTFRHFDQTESDPIDRDERYFTIN